MNRHLVFRCAKCRATTSWHAEWNAERPAEVACTSCDAVYQLDAGRDRADSDKAYYEQVRRYAVANRIDLASAYSVIEGIIPRDKVRTLPATSPEIPRGGSSAVRPLALLAMLIISLGFLAREFRPSGPTAATPDGDATAATRAQHLGGAEARVPESERVKLVPVSYQVDGAGRLTKVMASDPRAVLLAFCQHDSNLAALHPVSIAPGRPPGFDRRTGVVQEKEHAASFAWVPIWLDAGSGRWTIGDGRSPVGIERGRDLPPGAEMLTF